MHYNLFKQS